ncbi:MAG: phosphoribosylglycinamide formyltransferase [Candidatus Methylomirabilales bacterium]
MARSGRLRVGVLASGRGSNLQAIIDASEAGKLDAAVVVVLSDMPDVYALERARRYRIPGIFLDPKSYANREAFDNAVIAALTEHQVELVCLAGYMRVLTAAFVDHFRHRVMNIHPALLPSFPGLHGQRQALRHGVKFSGCTVHFADEGVDTGPIIIQAVVPVFDDDSEETLAARILRYEHQIYPRAIQFYAEGRLHVRGRHVTCRGSEADRAAREGWGYIHP